MNTSKKGRNGEERSERILKRERENEKRERKRKRKMKKVWVGKRCGERRDDE